jgi:hypothetical protein
MRIPFVSDRADSKVFAFVNQQDMHGLIPDGKETALAGKHCGAKPQGWAHGVIRPRINPALSQGRWLLLFQVKRNFNSAQFVPCPLLSVL